jgi:peptidoglycan/xylan/chitin deacetylase (PgdA/CDA1 family)
MNAPDPSNSDAPFATIALMYHAIGDGDADAQDPHYSVSPARFDAHLDTIAALAGGGTSARDWLEHPSSRVILTFDDGHVSNHRLAFASLRAHAMSADFFVNPGRVGEAGLASWSELREMAAAGMSIQSHGWNHTYFTDLAPAELRQDLLRSRSLIEDKIGQPVTLLAPPGGRMRADLPEVARDCGYRHVLGSQPGRIAASTPLLPRMAVTASLDETTIADWIAGRGITRARARYTVLGLAKRALGDRRYERVRERLLGHTGSEP